MADDFNKFSRDIRSHITQIRHLFNRRLPVKVGQMAQRHVQDNFLKSGYVDGGLHPWTPAKRLSQGGTSAAARHKTLMSSRKHLYSGTKYTPGTAQVTIFNDVAYAAVHQQGATINIPITPKMRRYAWARHYDATGRSKGSQSGKKGRTRATSEGDTMWKRLALTKKKQLVVKIPARPFIGPSRELSDKVTQLIEKELTNILNS